MESRAHVALRVAALIGAAGLVQAGVPCALNPTGFVLSDMAQIVGGAP
jgi:hypothetical protein